MKSLLADLSEWMRRRFAGPEEVRIEIASVSASLPQDVVLGKIEGNFLLSSFDLKKLETGEFVHRQTWLWSNKGWDPKVYPDRAGGAA